MPRKVGDDLGQLVLLSRSHIVLSQFPDTIGRNGLVVRNLMGNLHGDTIRVMTVQANLEQAGMNLRLDLDLSGLAVLNLGVAWSGGGSHSSLHP